VSESASPRPSEREQSAGYWKAASTAGSPSTRSAQIPTGMPTRTAGLSGSIATHAPAVARAWSRSRRIRRPPVSATQYTAAVTALRPLFFPINAPSSLLVGLLPLPRSSSPHFPHRQLRVDPPRHRLVATILPGLQEEHVLRLPLELGAALDFPPEHCRHERD